MNIFDFLNPTVFNNTLFYPLFTIFASYIAALLLSKYSAKNRNLLLLISIPILVSIVSISLHSYRQVCTVITDYNTFKIFLLSNLLLVGGGIFHNFQVKYMLVSYLISGPLHICFYFYSQHNEAAGIIATLFTPTLSYLTLLGWVYFIVSHLVLKEIHYDIIGNRMDGFLPTNECKSHRMVVLLQSYTMIIHMNFIYFIEKWFDYSLVSFSIVFAIIALQLFLIGVNLRILNKYPSSARVPFYVCAHLMIVKLLVDKILQNYKIYKNSQTFSLQPMCLSNRLIYLSLCLFVICIFNDSVAYASDEDSSAVTEGGSAGRYIRTGVTFAGGAGGYELLSMGREYWENLGDSNEQGAILNQKIQDCIAAKNTLNTIDWKLKHEFALIKEVDIYLGMVQENAEGADVEDLRKYVEKVEQYTTNLEASYKTYEQYKSNVTDRMYRWFCGVNCCSYGTPSVKES